MNFYEDCLLCKNKNDQRICDKCHLTENPKTLERKLSHFEMIPEKISFANQNDCSISTGSNSYNPYREMIIVADSITLKERSIGLNIVLKDNLSSVLKEIESIEINGFKFVKDRKE